jgi:hypothetical protein
MQINPGIVQFGESLDRLVRPARRIGFFWPHLRDHGSATGKTKTRVMHSVKKRSARRIDKIDGAQVHLYRSLAQSRKHISPALLHVCDPGPDQLTFQSKDYRVLFLFNCDPEHVTPGEGDSM